MTTRSPLSAAALALSMFIAACSGGNGSDGSTTTYTIGGSVTGLKGTGLVLENNGGGDLAVSADGTFVFAAPIASGGAYAVTVKTQPSSPSQTCTATGATGIVANANVANVAITCVTNTYKVGGTVNGLAGSGLVLENNGGDDLAVTANGTFSFATMVASGGAYSVTVKTMPQAASQTCAVGLAQGSVTNSDVSNIVVTCVTNTYLVSGAVTGLSGTGLVLQNNAETLPIAANGNFQFFTPVPSGAAYNVSVATQPSNPAQTCAIAGGSGTIGNANAGNVVVTCTTATAQCGSENGTIVMHAANVSADETWAGAGTVHLVTNTIEILAPATVTIQKCAIVKLKTGVQIVVSGDLSGGIAKLLVAGDDPATGRVYFQTADINQFWGSLVGANKNSLIELNYAVILDGGNDGGSARNAVIAMTGNSTLPDPVLKINNTTIASMLGAGVYLDNAAFTADSALLSISDSPDYPIALSAMALGSLPSYVSTGNAHDEALVVNNANIFDNLTIHNRLPIHFKTDGVRVAGLAPTFVANITLTLDPGVVLKFERASTAPPMVIFGTNGQTNDENAALVANGTAFQPVVFTSAAATPAPGDWAGIWLLTSNGSQLDNVIIEYAGGDASIGPLNCGPFDPSINQQARHTAALLVGDGTDMQYVPPASLITNSTFRNNTGNFAIDSVWETTVFGPSLTHSNTFSSPGKFCPQSKNLIPLGCTVGGVDQSGCLP